MTAAGACGVAPHDVAHLFDCAAAPTDLAIVDLWTKPMDVVVFLSSLPSFSSLPPSPVLLLNLLLSSLYFSNAILWQQQQRLKTTKDD